VSTPDPDKANEAVTPVEAMVSAIRTEMFPEGALCTSWVLATEWMSADSEYYVIVLTDDQSPPWRHVGLLAKASADLDEQLATEEMEDEDEDEDS
jgi:hypothetical protein